MWCGAAQQTFKKQVGPLSSSRARVKNGLGQARTRLGVAGLISGSHRTIFRPYSSLSSNRIPCSHRFPQSPITIIKRILLPVRPPLRGRAAIPLPQTPAFHRTFGRIRHPSVDPIPSYPRRTHQTPPVGNRQPPVVRSEPVSRCRIYAHASVR